MGEVTWEPVNLTPGLDTCLGVITILGFGVMYPPRVLGWELGPWAAIVGTTGTFRS